ncbi:hypothetical protein COB55_05845 [Candidatus Wolfebacteria bacterium]|nr:MAG: hypothetical protein COB55_05845 [Candidatus Wolfebacteria bacterium]
MKKRTFHAFSDPGHGWLKVPLKLIIELNINLSVTSYSYYRNGFVYLEEDGDWSLFHDAMTKRFGSYNTKGFITDKSSKIRNYKSFNSLKTVTV